MKYIFFLFISMAFVVADAKPQIQTVAEISFDHARKPHVYSLTKTVAQDPIYVLSFKDERGRVKKKDLSSSQASGIEGELSRIMWENQFRKPASVANCHSYAVLKMASEKTKICEENAPLTARTFGLLNSLHQMTRGR